MDYGQTAPFIMFSKPVFKVSEALPVILEEVCSSPSMSRSETPGTASPLGTDPRTYTETSRSPKTLWYSLRVALTASAQIGPLWSTCADGKMQAVH